MPWLVFPGLAMGKEALTAFVTLYGTSLGFFMKRVGLCSNTECGDSCFQLLANLPKCFQNKLGLLASIGCLNVLKHSNIKDMGALHVRGCGALWSVEGMLVVSGVTLQEVIIGA